MDFAERFGTEFLVRFITLRRLEADFGKLSSWSTKLIFGTVLWLSSSNVRFWSSCLLSIEIIDLSKVGCKNISDTIKEGYFIYCFHHQILESSEMAAVVVFGSLARGLESILIKAYTAFV